MRWRWVGVLVAAGAAVAALGWAYAPVLWPMRVPPRTPPREPPPGRPFVARPVTYAGATPSAAALRQAVKGRNVIICVLDAARVDHFGAYGYPRETTPNFDRLAKESLLFEQHFCQEPETRPSTASLLTGLQPETHGLVDNQSAGSLPSSLPTLEAAFAKAGYTTYLLSSNPIASPVFGLGADFQRFPHQGGLRPNDPVTQLAQEVGDALPRQTAQRKPFFMYLHVLPPHLPYAAPAEFARPFQGRRPPRYWRSRQARGTRRGRSPGEPEGSWVEWTNAYDANLRWADSFLGKLEEELRTTGLLEQTLLIVTADHGEALAEHGTSFHSACPYDEALHIPLLLRLPGEHKSVGRVQALTQTIDLFPTLLDLEGLPPVPVQGRSLVPLLSGQAGRAHEYLVSISGGNRPSSIVRDAHLVLVIGPRGEPRLYDMDADPWEVDDIYAAQRPRAAALERACDEFAREQASWRERLRKPGRGGGADRKASGTLTEAQRRTLKSLGYLE